MSNDKNTPPNYGYRCIYQKDNTSTMGSLGKFHRLQSRTKGGRIIGEGVNGGNWRLSFPSPFRWPRQLPNRGQGVLREGELNEASS